MDYFSGAGGCISASYLRGTNAQGARIYASWCFPIVSTGAKEYLLAGSDGEHRLFTFDTDSDHPAPNSNVNIRAERVIDGSGASIWHVFRPEGAVERYSSGGRLLDRTYADGGRTTYTYSDSETPAEIAPYAGLLIAQSDPWGRTVSLAYDAGGKLVQLTDPAGNHVTYTYDTSGAACLEGECNLIAGVQYQDQASRVYHWNESSLTGGFNLPRALTGVTDEEGGRSSFGYNKKGWAISTERAGGVDQYTIPARSSISVSVMDPRGTLRQTTLQSNQGVVYATGNTQPAGSGCPASASSMTYDANGNVTSRTDFNGNTTTYTYDTSRNLETRRIEGAGSSEARTVTTNWHPFWRFKTSVAEPKRITHWVYNGQPDPSNGNTVLTCAPNDAFVIDDVPIAVVCKTIEQATTDADGSAGFNATPIDGPRILTHTYDRYGKLLSVDGPRLDVADVTSYSYWAADGTCPGGEEGVGLDKGCRGELKSVTDALGNISQYLKYNSHGQVLEMRDPNGLVTSFDYDLRQRLVAKLVGNLLTNYTYDRRGLLTRITRPDGSYLAYSYDDAHRLVGVSDAAGNSVSYVLDAAGNRTGASVKDASGALQRTTQMEYDALSRLQRVVLGAGQ